MNSHTRETIEKCAREADAIVQCEMGHDNYVNAYDEIADSNAYAQATNAWKVGDPGFRSMTLDQVRSSMKRFLGSYSDRCPKCHDLLS